MLLIECFFVEMTPSKLPCVFLFDIPTVFFSAFIMWCHIPNAPFDYNVPPLKKKQAAIKVKLIGADACLFSAVLEAKKKKIWMLLLPPGRMAKCSQSFPSGLFWNANVVSSLRWMFAVGFEVWLICLCKPLAWVEH